MSNSDDQASVLLVFMEKSVQELDVKKVEFHSTISRHSRVDASITLLIWLNEKVEFHSCGTHGAVAASE